MDFGYHIRHEFIPNYQGTFLNVSKVGLFEEALFKMDSQKRLEQIGTGCFSHAPQGLKNGNFFIPFSGGMRSQRKCQFIEI